MVTKKELEKTYRDVKFVSHEDYHNDAGVP